jgi:hypothetical protein
MVRPESVERLLPGLLLGLLPRLLPRLLPGLLQPDVSGLSSLFYFFFFFIFITNTMYLNHVILAKLMNFLLHLKSQFGL